MSDMYSRHFIDYIAGVGRVWDVINGRGLEGYSMLARLFGKKCNHPMADVKSAQALLAGLPKNDMLKSAVELTDWLESVTDCEAFGLADQFAVINVLDERAQQCSRKLQAEYFTLLDLHVFQGNRLCLVLGNLARQTTQAYLMLFNRYCKGDKEAVAFKASLPLLVARAVRAERECLKYASLHYAPHENAVWDTLAQLYRHAGQQNYLDTRLRLYSTNTELTSVKFEAGQMLAWYACGVNSLSTRGMHLAERLIGHYGDAIEITARLTEHALFGFDLAHPFEPVRVALDSTVHPQMRYIGMAGMQAGLETLLNSLEKDFVPPEINLGGVFRAEWVLEAVKHIVAVLRSPPLRSGKRLEMGGIMKVVSGYDNLLERCLDLAQQGKACAFEEWALDNVSASGFSAILKGRGIESIGIANLLGIQVMGTRHLGVAVVRRLLQDGKGGLQVGAEVLANQVALVNVRQSVGGGSGNALPVLWLYEKSGSKQEVARLLLPAGSFSMNRSLVSRFEEKNYLLIPVGLEESNEDYELASFRTIEQV